MLDFKNCSITKYSLYFSKVYIQRITVENVHNRYCDVTPKTSFNIYSSYSRLLKKPHVIIIII